jgi:hypothetical protein
VGDLDPPERPGRAPALSRLPLGLRRAPALPGDAAAPHAGPALHQVGARKPGNPRRRTGAPRPTIRSAASASSSTTTSSRRSADRTSSSSRAPSRASPKTRS